METGKPPWTGADGSSYSWSMEFDIVELWKTVAVEFGVAEGSTMSNCVVGVEVRGWQTRLIVGVWLDITTAVH